MLKYTLQNLSLRDSDSLISGGFGLKKKQIADVLFLKWHYLWSVGNEGGYHLSIRYFFINFFFSALKTTLGDRFDYSHFTDTQKG